MAGPDVLLTTEEGNVKLTKYCEGVTMYAERSVQILVAELLPERYGIVACKYDSSANPPVNPAEDTCFSAIMDDAFKFECKEQSHEIDIYLFNFEIGDWSVQYHLEFEAVLDWFECVRLLTEGKAKHTLYGLRLHFRLDAAVALLPGVIPDVAREPTA